MKIWFCIIIIYLSFTIASFGNKTISYTEGMTLLLRNNAKIMEDKAALLTFSVDRVKADGLLIPTIDIMSFVTTINEGKGNALNYSTNYEKWGPYLYTQGEVVWPVFSFGRIDAARSAARFGEEAGKDLHQNQINEVLFEYKKIYLSHILLKRLKSVLDDASGKMQEALSRALATYSEGEGKIKKKDIARLKLYSYEIEKLFEEWKYRNQLASIALGHYLGIAEQVTVAIRS